MRIPYFIELMFANRLSYLRNFKRKGAGLFNFSCPVCGDSSHVKSKARGYFYTRENKLFASCHNCGLSTTFPNFVKTVNEPLYKEMVLESLKVNGDLPQPRKELVVPKSRLPQKTVLSILPKLEGKGLVYATNRKIPESQFGRIGYTKNFRELVQQLHDFLGVEKEVNLPDKIEAVVFPYFNANKELIFIQGRNISSEKPKIRYLTDEIVDSPKLFGAELLDISKEVLVTEGPIDSLFLPNAVATGDAVLTRAESIVQKDNLTLVFDNEPRSGIAVSKMRKALKQGYRIVIFPDHIVDKDINDMVLSGIDVNQVIKDNKFKGMTGLLRLAQWSRA
jgi:transcription elongation factor Elf1